MEAKSPPLQLEEININYSSVVPLFRQNCQRPTSKTTAFISSQKHKVRKHLVVARTSGKDGDGYRQLG